MTSHLKPNRRTFLKSNAGLLAALPMGIFARNVSALLPNVLILGDSISIGYTPHVRELLSGVAEVSRPDENCQGTVNGVGKLAVWLGTTNWDVIHFNFGLHDLKHVDPDTGKNSSREDHPKQATPKQYEQHLKAIVKVLKKTGARLIFATTTPFPDRPEGPLRRSADVAVYNRIALKIMKRNGIMVNDLHAFVLPRMEELQLPANVHFTKQGSAVLAGEVAAAIRRAIG